MAVAKTPREKTDLPKTPTECSNSIIRVAVAQIVQSVGYRRSQPSALQALTTICTHYLRSFAAAASAHGTHCGRTQCNLFDIVHALEELASPHGFTGGSNVQASLPSSGILEDLSKFMRCKRELPFAKPLPGRKKPMPALRTSNGNPVSMGDRGRKPEVPQWLPDFPDMRTECEPEREELYWEQKWGDRMEFKERKGGAVNLLKSGDKRKRMLLMRSGRVKFRIGAGKVKGKVETKLDPSFKKTDKIFRSRTAGLCA